MITRVRSRLLFVFLLLGIFGIGMISVVAVGSLDTTLGLPLSVKLNVNYFSPQGWAFFTRDAREDKVIFLKYGQSAKLDRVQRAIFSPEYCFGLNRQVRKISLEYSLFTTQMDSLRWIDFAGNVDSLSRFTRTLSPIEIENRSLSPNLCGEIIVVKAKIKPWAWARFPSVNMPSKIMKLYVTCSDK